MIFPKKRKSDELKKRDDGPIHLTKDGLERLQGQLERLKQSLPELIADARKAASYGDRSENFEYKEAKSILRRTQGRILNIQDQIKRVTLIASGPNVSGKVQLGSTVVLETDGAQRTFQILGSHETNPDKGRISFKSPLGAALMNRAKGEIITVKTISGSKEYKIIEIK